MIYFAEWVSDSYFQINVSDIWDFERKYFFNAVPKPSETYSRWLLGFLEEIITEFGESSFGIEPGDIEDENPNSYYNRHFNEYRESITNLDLAYRIEYFFRGDKCYQFLQTIILPKEHKHFSTLFILKLRQFQFNILPLKDFLLYQLLKNFQSDLKLFKDFVNDLLAQDTGDLLTQKLSERIIYCFSELANVQNIETLLREKFEEEFIDLGLEDDENFVAQFRDEGKEDVPPIITEGESEIIKKYGDGKETTDSRSPLEDAIMDFGSSEVNIMEVSPSPIEEPVIRQSVMKEERLEQDLTSFSDPPIPKKEIEIMAEAIPELFDILKPYFSDEDNEALLKVLHGLQIQPFLKFKGGAAQFADVFWFYTRDQTKKVLSSKIEVEKWIYKYFKYRSKRENKFKRFDLAHLHKSISTQARRCVKTLPGFELEVR